MAQEGSETRKKQAVQKVTVTFIFQTCITKLALYYYFKVANQNARY